MKNVAIILCLAAACQDEPAPLVVWTPGTTYPSDSSKRLRGMLDLRGLIHAHSPYSHDACDGKPLIDGQPDPVCMADLRRGLCQSKHDFVMLTDHSESGHATPYPQVLLYDSELGDALVERAERPVASWMNCQDSKLIVMAGMESGMMPVGLEHHIDARYNRPPSAEAAQAFKDAGAVVLLQHTEDWSVDELSELPIDGFEMYNLHNNTLVSADIVLEMLFRVLEGRLGLPHPDLFLVPFVSEDPRYLERWSKVLARGHKRVGTMGTDSHRNTFEAKLADGERIDSYRRMMIAFSNHLLVRPEADGSWDDRHLKDALRAGRLYGVFEMLGYPQGFDFLATDSAGIMAEMGDELSLANSPTLTVKRPELRHLDATLEAPIITARLLLATEEGWLEVAKDKGDLSFTPSQPGAYRAEIRIRPRHLRRDLGHYDQQSLTGDMVWIYANPIYISP
jgi:hypothetical protein